jgi:hypothetical protein
MQVVRDLDGVLHKWQLSGNISKGTITNKSSLHLEARKLIHETYPTLQILEEVSIPIRRSESLYLDFYLPLIKKCIEVHGEQHYKFVKFYHQTILGFAKSKKRDAEKQEWCEKNNITYIELPYNEIESWVQRITNEHQRTG